MTTRKAATRNSKDQHLFNEKMITYNDKRINDTKGSLSKLCLETLQLTTVLPISTFVCLFGFLIMEKEMQKRQLTQLKRSKSYILIVFL